MQAEVRFALAHVRNRAEGSPGALERLLDSVQDPDVAIAQEMNIQLSSVCLLGPTMCQAAFWFGGQQGTEEAEPLSWWGALQQGGLSLCGLASMYQRVWW